MNELFPSEDERARAMEDWVADIAVRGQWMREVVEENCRRVPSWERIEKHVREYILAAEVLYFAVQADHAPVVLTYGKALELLLRDMTNQPHKTLGRLIETLHKDEEWTRYFSDDPDARSWALTRARDVKAQRDNAAHGSRTIPIGVAEADRVRGIMLGTRILGGGKLERVYGTYSARNTSSIEGPPAAGGLIALLLELVRRRDAG